SSLDNWPIRLVVVDANALIKNFDLEALHAECFTVPDVIAEIRDKQSQEALLKRKDIMKTRIPTEEAFQAVIAFAKKTGDFATLSVADLKVLALTYTLEKEQNGSEHIRIEPLKMTAGTVKPQRPQKQSKETMAAYSLPKEKKADTKPSESVNLEEKAIDELPEEKTEEVPVDGWDEDAADDSEGEHKAKDAGAADVAPIEDNTRVFVGCLTSDFAMQNVLLQMNLKLVSREGEIIRKTKSWALRCHACFKITMDLAKQFCPSCGNNTLMRASISVDSTGKMNCYLKKNFQYNVRGTKKALSSSQIDGDFEAIFGQASGSRPGPGVQIGHGRKNVNSTRGRRR
ncbi:Nin one binding Zn-ribbon like-domain-containing protein, partial [Chytridium lagenaria]